MASILDEQDHGGPQAPAPGDASPGLVDGKAMQLARLLVDVQRKLVSDPDGARALLHQATAILSTQHLGDRVHPVVASAARELLNKSENERSGVLSTAMSFLGLYRDPVVAEVTSRCDWRIADLVEADKPVSLYLVIPPSDISRTKPLIRLLLNQIGRRLTEGLEAATGRRPLLLMLDEFPALGCLDFFEQSLAFMAGYGIRSFLIAQSLNQIEKAYGPNNSILDNCHIRVAFATNDERTAKRISDSLGTATEMRALKNYAGHRLSPWLGHLMVSRQETARALLTPGEIMQLPADEAIIFAGAARPIRARKIRYYSDARLAARVRELDADRERFRSDVGSPWKTVLAPATSTQAKMAEQFDEGGLKQEPELARQEHRASMLSDPPLDGENDADGDEAQQGREFQRRFAGVANQAAMDHDDGIPLGDDL